MKAEFITPTQDFMLESRDIIDAGLAAKEARGSLVVHGDDLDKLPTDLSDMFELYPNQWYRVEEDFLTRGVILYWKYGTPSITTLK